VIVDIDECAAGGIASSCNSTVGGVCVGVLPVKNFNVPVELAGSWLPVAPPVKVCVSVEWTVFPL